MINIIIILLCAFANRIRGGMFGNQIRMIIPFWSTTIARISMTGIMLIPLWFKPFPWWVCIWAWVFLYVGFIFGWKAWQAMTNIPKDIFSMGLRGLLLTGTIGIFLHNTPLALCGLSMGVIYYIGKFLPITTELDGSQTNNVTWGEYIFGGVLGYFIACV